MYLIRKCATCHPTSIFCHFRKFSERRVAMKNFAVTKEDPNSIRNIGILAHIDAGKTTTTERMLFYSGAISHMGEVHHGNTVTDFMEQERERGITITSASVTFQWEKHNINLLDTPGHIDFTMEVEQTVSVMDGAIVILDGSAGVEAQTITVWKQAERHGIPRLIYVNKMDKPKAEFIKSAESIFKQFKFTPLLLQIPVYNEDKNFKGVVDLLTLVKYEWNPSLSNNFNRKVLNPQDDKLWENSLHSRIKLVETVADLDDEIADIIISDEKKLQTISSSTLRDAIRRITLQQKGVPVLCGSSYKNIGVQNLMDAIIYYLPSPMCKKTQKVIAQCFDNKLCAKAFKVRHDPHKGPITFFRIYSGKIRKGEKIYNMKNKKTDQCERLYIALADEYEEVPEVGMGNIVAVTGLKHTACGELVTSSAFSLEKALSSVSNLSSTEKIFSGASIPDPVFFCSIEAPSHYQQSMLDKALSELQKEDPSLRVSVSNETGQTVLGGMGELHLDIIKERIRKDYKIDADLGPLQIAYKETLISNAKDSFLLKHQLGNTYHSVNLTMSVLKSIDKGSDKLLLDRSPDCVQNISSIFPKHLLAIKTGVERALESGPKLFCPVVNVSVMLHWLEVGRGTSDSIITSATVQCIKKLLAKGGTSLLEPIMLIEIVCSQKEMEVIIRDLSRRRAEICSTEIKQSDMVLRAFVPLSELLGYATELRILTSGKANFSMELDRFKEMDAAAEAKAIKSVTGF